MLCPPYLELQYFVGKEGVASAVHALVKGVAENVTPRKLVVRDVVGLSSKSEEVEIIGGIVVLRTEGEAFCGPEREDLRRLTQLGRQVYQRFTELADRLQPTYGAILVEYTLEEPAELRKDPRSLAFRDFFVHRERLGEHAIDAIIRLAGEDAYVERLHVGAYISMSSEFNPKARSVPSLIAQERSTEIAAVVARAVR